MHTEDKTYSTIPFLDVRVKFYASTIARKVLFKMKSSVGNINSTRQNVELIYTYMAAFSGTDPNEDDKFYRQGEVATVCY